MSRVVETIDMNGRRVIDVSGLEDHAFDSRDPVWWGNTLLIFIESMTIVLLLASYYYLRRNFDIWPPPQPNAPLFSPEALKVPLSPAGAPSTLPDLPIPTIELLLFVGICFLMHRTDRAARRNDRPRTLTGLWIMLGITLVTIVLRFMEMRTSHLKFRWDDNAYASIIW